MSVDRLETMLQGIREYLKAMNIQDGDILTHSDETQRIHLSTYRLTVEMRFPDGIRNLPD